MGNRAVLVIETQFGANQEPSRVFFYAHWAGQRIFEALVDGSAAQRSSADYCARVVFEKMISDSAGEILNYGISAVPIESEHPIPVLRFEANKILLYFEDRYGEEELTPRIDRDSLPYLLDEIVNWRYEARMGGLYRKLIPLMEFYHEYGIIEGFQEFLHSGKTIAEWNLENSEDTSVVFEEVPDTPELPVNVSVDLEEFLGGAKLAICKICGVRMENAQDHQNWHRKILKGLKEA